MPTTYWSPFQLDHPTRRIGNSLLIQADCFDWMQRIPALIIHAIVTDPPYSVLAEQVQR